VIKKTEQPPVNKGFIFCLVIALALCASAAASLGIHIRFTGTAEGLPFWAGIINIGVLALGLAALLFYINIQIKKFRALQDLVKPLAEKDLGALLRLPKPEPGVPAGEEIPGLKEAVPLREALWSLGRLFESLHTLVSQSKGMRNILRDDSGERDAIHHHLGEVIDKIAKQFFEIESSAQQAMESLGGIEGSVHSFSGAEGNQSAVLEEAENNLARVSDLSEGLAARIRESAGMAETLVNEIGAGEENAQEVYDIVKNISRQVEGISEITAIINQISEQTNILSMNAAIESAHAGQAGAGFAVVADEIRKLAESTKENAGRIHDELLAIIKNTQGALKSSETSSAALNGITGRIGSLSKELTEILSSILETSAINGTIRASVKEIAGFCQQFRDSGADMMAHQQSFKSTLELIQSLSDTTRAEIKEIHSGTREILDNISKTQERILEGLDQTGKITLLPGIPLNPQNVEEDKTAPPAGTDKAAPPVQTTALKPAGPGPEAHPSGGSQSSLSVFSPAGGIDAAAGELPDEAAFSDSREVTVKRPPQTI
jgi:methyl-accepting chemotaxis protein